MLFQPFVKEKQLSLLANTSLYTSQSTNYSGILSSQSMSTSQSHFFMHVDSVNVSIALLDLSKLTLFLVFWSLRKDRSMISSAGVKVYLISFVYSLLSRVPLKITPTLDVPAFHHNLWALVFPYQKCVGSGGGEVGGGWWSKAKGIWQMKGILLSVSENLINDNSQQCWQK